MRSSLDITRLCSMLLGALAGCASYAGGDEVAEATSGTDATANAISDGTARVGEAYFEIAKDVRKCAAPYCGGWNLARLNSAATTCHDGRSAAECYTPVLDWTFSNLPVAEQAKLLAACDEAAGTSEIYAVVRGQFARVNTTTPAPELGRFVIKEAWIIEGDAQAQGPFVRVRDNGRRCLVAPCPSLTEEALNASKSQDISAIDYTPAGLSSEQIVECNEATFTAQGLLVAGPDYTFTQNGTKATGRAATAAFYPLGAR